MEFIDNDPDFFGDDALSHLLAASHEDSISTSFSGIESPHTAACCNRLALARKLGLDPSAVPFPRLHHMIKWDSESQAELLIVARQTGACLFGDIASFFRPELKETIDHLKVPPRNTIVFSFQY